LRHPGHYRLEITASRSRDSVPWRPLTHLAFAAQQRTGTPRPAPRSRPAPPGCPSGPSTKPWKVRGASAEEPQLCSGICGQAGCAGPPPQPAGTVPAALLRAAPSQRAGAAGPEAPSVRTNTEARHRSDQRAEPKPDQRCVASRCHPHPWHGHPRQPPPHTGAPRELLPTRA